MDNHSFFELDGDDHYDHLDSPDHWFSVSGQTTREAYRQRMSSWILRILLGHGGMPAFHVDGSGQHQLLSAVLEVPELADPSCKAAAVFEALQVRAQKFLGPLAMQGEANWPVAPCCMSTTLAWLGNSAGLNSVELAIFELAVALRVFDALKKAVKTWGSINRGDLPHALSAVLNLPLEEVQTALSSKGSLLSSGILRMYPGGEEWLGTLLFVPRQLSEAIAYHQGPPEEILAHMATPLRGDGLSLGDFAHIPHHTALARSWLEGVLKAASDGHTAGHMLVTGMPGLGKTEWCRALLKESSVQAMEMVVTNDRGGALTGEDRLHHLRLVMRMMRATPRGAILFDEADDVFRPPESDFGHRRGSGDADAVSMDNHRAALNQLLEGSRIPVIWIMNRPEVLDRAVLRRFDVEIHFEGIPRSVRLGLIQKRFAPRQHRPAAITETEQQRWAEVSTLTPALIDRLGQVHARGEHADVPMDATLCRHWLRQRLPGRPTQHLQIPIEQGAYTEAFTEAFTWSPTRVNASVDLMELVAGIGKVGSARLALCGLPGTGKTAFAKALANMLDKPLVEQRASDLLSAYVGETEQRIRTAFEKALEEGALLFIDEVDGLLANRDMAARTWEVTQVNELLEQLGEYTGVVVIATNRMQAIDPAAMRRLDMQITFEPLRPEQVREGFAALCKAHAIEVEICDLDSASQITGVTPGDFAALSRRMRFAPDARTAATLICLLQELQTGKQPRRAPMGFVSGRAATEADDSV
ncbi:AAA family ATPase [Rhodoferax sp. GW822-FHT02A01]|uniref:AAA family ATPase n=1 Tax=Rhodoferax sp. GW822-FHT02A01 TaxID=3141537 RepID=UPI00315DC1DB